MPKAPYYQFVEPVVFIALFALIPTIFLILVLFDARPIRFGVVLALGCSLVPIILCAAWVRGRKRLRMQSHERQRDLGWMIILADGIALAAGLMTVWL